MNEEIEPRIPVKPQVDQKTYYIIAAAVIGILVIVLLCYLIFKLNTVEKKPVQEPKYDREKEMAQGLKERFKDREIKSPAELKPSGVFDPENKTEELAKATVPDTENDTEKPVN